MVEPFVSVVVCTYNRVEFLQKCLDSLLSQHKAPAFEIIVVDNNSKDSTADLVQAYSEKSKVPIRYVFEPVQGLSKAKNTGARSSWGRFVAFLDDDAAASDGWVCAIEEGASKHPEFAVHSGPVHGNFETPRPAWLSSKIEFAVSIGNFDAEFREKKPGELVFGGNMAFRRDVFDQIGGFLEDLGRTGTNLLAAEEVEYCERLNRHGYKILNNPKMEIWHWVPKTRLVKSYVYDRMYWNGRSIAVWDRLRKRSIIVRTLGRILYAIPRYAVGMLLNWFKEDERFYYSCHIKKNFGYISQTLEMITSPSGGGMNMSLTSKLIQILVQKAKKDSKYLVDPNLDFRSALAVLLPRGLALLRGLFWRPFLKKGFGMTFIGKGVTIFSPHRLSVGRSFTLGDFATIDALSQEGITLGDNVTLERYTMLRISGTLRKLGKGIRIGNNTGVGAYSYIGAGGGVEIGSHVSIGQRVNFHAENHEFRDAGKLIAEQGVTSKGICVEDDCWIGSGSIILDGVTIGRGSVVAAGAVVTKTVEPYSIVAGVPARVVGMREGHNPVQS